MVEGETIVADKARMTRKQVKQPDEFITLTHRAIAWGRSHQQMVVGGAVAAAVMVAAIGIATAYRAAQRRDANADLAQALAKVDANDYAAAADELSAVAKRWSGTSIAPLATLMAADSAVQAGEADKAITLLGGVQGASLPPYLQQQALMAWGAALERKQQWAEAAAKYKDAAAVAGPYTAAAVVGEARALEQAGETDRSRELYRQAYEQFPELPGRELLTTKFSAS
jgi:predicted negative regulator of RcsB-dependent stress response